MVWLSQRWPTIVSIVGLVWVTVMIWNEVPVQDYGTYADEDASGMALILLILVWWGCYFGVAFAIRRMTGWLRSRAIWLLLVAPIIGVWFVNKTVEIASQELAISEIVSLLFVSTGVAALPILLGLSSQIVERVQSLRTGRGTVAGSAVSNRKE